MAEAWSVRGLPIARGHAGLHECDARIRLLTAYDVTLLAQPVDVNKLVKGRPLDNMEFMQWLKFYFEGRMGCQNLDYDPVGRRCRLKLFAMPVIAWVKREGCKTRIRASRCLQGLQVHSFL